jgi:hypothetical protein
MGCRYWSPRERRILCQSPSPCPSQRATPRSRRHTGLIPGRRPAEPRRSTAPGCLAEGRTDSCLQRATDQAKARRRAERQRLERARINRVLYPAPRHEEPCAAGIRSHLDNNDIVHLAHPNHDRQRRIPERFRRLHAMAAQQGSRRRRRARFRRSNRRLTPPGDDIPLRPPPLRDMPS